MRTSRKLWTVCRFHLICCFFTIRLATISLTADSTNPVESKRQTQSTKLTLDGKILGMFGKSGKQLGQFGWIHEIACPSENELYVGELLNWRVQKILLEAKH
jgi:hypothetical protein